MVRRENCPNGSRTPGWRRILLGFWGHSITPGVHRVMSVKGFIARPEHEMDLIFDSSGGQGHGRRAGRLTDGMRPPPVPPSPSNTTISPPPFGPDVVEHDPPVAPEMVGARPALGARQADGAEVGGPDELGVEGQPRHGPGPAVHERHGDHRAHGGLALGEVGAGNDGPGPPPTTRRSVTSRYLPRSCAAGPRRNGPPR